MSVLFYGDPHGDFDSLFDAVDLHRPEHVVLLGDQSLDAPLAERLLPVTQSGAALHWIYGNHDAHTPAMHDFLFDAEGGLHGLARSCPLAGGTLTLAGLGGHYKGRVWSPKVGDEQARWRTRAEFLRQHGKGGLYRGGMPLGHRQTIFPEDHEALAILRGVDILVVHEAPTSMEGGMGFGAIDDLARDMGVRMVVHGHHHVSYRGTTRDGIPVRGMGQAEAWLCDLPPRS
jgi:predicted phosphodiesterase